MRKQELPVPRNKAETPPRKVTPYPAKGAFGRAFASFANATAHASGMPLTFILAVVIVVAWAVSGPLFHFSDTWQLVINTSTTIVTFLMVFLIQNTQNRDGLAIQVKFDELLRALETANNRIVGIESLSEDEVKAIREEVLDQTEGNAGRALRTAKARGKSKP